MIFLIIEYGIIATSLWFVISQILIPSFRGLPWFPLFNTKHSKLKKEMKELLEEQQLQQEGEELSKLRNKVNPPKEEQTNGTK